MLLRTEMPTSKITLLHVYLDASNPKRNCSSRNSSILCLERPTAWGLLLALCLMHLSFFWGKAVSDFSRGTTGLLHLQGGNLEIAFWAYLCGLTPVWHQNPTGRECQLTCQPNHYKNQSEFGFNDLHGLQMFSHMLPQWWEGLKRREIPDWNYRVVPWRAGGSLDERERECHLGYQESCWLDAQFGCPCSLFCWTPCREGATAQEGGRTRNHGTARSSSCPLWSARKHWSKQSLISTTPYGYVPENTQIVVGPKYLFV